MKRLALAAAILPFASYAETVPADQALKDMGFADTSYLYSSAQTVSDQVSGDVNIQAGANVSGGEIITIGRSDNTFTGGAFVKSGTLVVPSIGMSYLATPLGFTRTSSGTPGAPIALGLGTLRFTGGGLTDRDFALTQDASALDRVPTIWVDDGMNVVTMGRFLQPRANYGNLMKRGAGTFTLATKTPGSVNRIGRVANLATKTGKLNQDANGNFPSAGYAPFTITDGRFVIDTGDAVTNYLNQVRIGSYTTDEGAETAGHLEIRGGTTFIYGSYLDLGLENGKAATAPVPMRSSLDICGGTTVVTGAVRMVYGYNTAYNPFPEINVSGGRLDVHELTLNQQISRGRISVSGGRFRLDSAVVGVNYSGATLDIALSGVGELFAESLKYGNTTEAFGTISVVDDAILSVARITSTAYSKSKEDLLLGGGLLKFTGGEGNETPHFYGRNLFVGANGGTVELAESPKLGPECRMAISNAYGVAADGGLLIRNSSPSLRSFRFFASVASTGGVRAEGNVALKVKDGSYPTTFTVPASASFGVRIADDAAAEQTATVGSLVYPDAIGRLDVGFSFGSTKKCWKVVVSDSFVPPSQIFSIGCYDHRSDSTSSPVGTWDVMDFPASTSFDPSTCRIANRVDGRSYVFSVVESDDVKTLRLTIGNAADVAASEQITVASGEEETVSSVRDFWTTATASTISGEGVLTISAGACARFNGGVTFGVKTLNLNGGAVISPTPFADGATGTVNWNGTVFYPVPTVNGNEIFKNYSDSGDARIVLGSSGGTVDTSLLPCDYVWFIPKMSGTGTLTVCGQSPEKALFLRGYGYSAAAVPTTIDFCVEAGGCLSVYGDNFKNHTAVVKNGGTIGGANGRGDIKHLTLGETASDVVRVCAWNKVTDSPATSERVRVMSSLTVNGNVLVTFRSGATSGAYTQYKLQCPANGRYMVLEAPSGSIDASKFALDPMIAAGKKGVFDVTTGSADVLYVTISDADDAPRTPSAPAGACATTHNWTGGSGTFDDDANWDVAPEFASSEKVAFNPSADIVVSNSSAVALASVVNSSAHAVTLSGGAYAFGDDAAFEVSDPSGSLVLAGDVYGTGPLSSDQTSGAGALVVAGRVCDPLRIVRRSGYIAGEPSAFGTATLQPENSTVKFLGSGVFAGSIEHKVDSTGVGVDVAEGDTVVMTGDCRNYSLLTKVGGGTFHLKCPTAANIGNSNKTPGTPLFPENGDAPNVQTLTVFSGRVVIDCDATLSGQTRVGPTPILRDGGATAFDAELVVLSGTSSLGEFSVGYTFNYNYTDYTALDVRPRRIVNVLGGTLECTGFTMGQSASGANNDAGYNEVNVNGGTIRMTDATKWFAVGYDGDQQAKVTKDGKGNENVLNVNAGLVERSAGGTIGIGWAVCGDVGFRPCRGTINMNGGVLRTSGAIDLAYNIGGVDKATRGHVVGTLNLNGGRVEANRLTRTCSYLCETTVNMDGGVLAMTGDDAAVTNIPSINVCAGGAVFEVGGACTVSVPLVHAAALDGEPDGGLVKTGAGTLAIDAASTFTGPVEVREGTLALGSGASAISALRIDMSQSSGAIAGLKTAPDAVLYIDNYSGEIKGTVALPVLATGSGFFSRVVVNGRLVDGRTARIADGMIVTSGLGMIVVVF